MSKFKLFSNIKITVLIGYFILFGLVTLGLSRTYKELVILSEFANPLSERKELGIVSNALVALYESESMRKIVLSDNLYNPSLKSNYDVFDQKVRLYVDSLYQISENEQIKSDLDTVILLLEEKKENFIGIIVLMDSIRALPYSDVFSTSILTQRDIENLAKISDNKRVEVQDTAYYIKERRSFIDRVRAVFANKGDSTKVVSSSEKTHLDSVSYTPAEMITDTLVKYVNRANARSDKRKIAYMNMLTVRQNKMLLQDEMLSEQIHNILKKIEDDEKKIADQITDEKDTVLQRSSKVISRIAFAGLLVLLLFLPLTIFLVNRNQKYRIKLEESNDFAQKLLKSRERLLLMISHDVKAPLSSIIGHIELMFKDKMSKDDKEHLISMRSSSEQILDLSNKLMDFHRMEQGKSEINIMQFSPYQLLDDVYAGFVPLANKKNLKLISNLHIEKEKIYKSDPFILRQILNNLINNAIKFTHSGEIIIQSKINRDLNLLQISVKDTGVGINADEIEHVFEEFGRAGTSEEKHNIDGFGLGLPITKKLISLLNGKIDLQSEIGKGTEFLVTIPIIASDEGMDLSNEALIPEPNPFHATILFVDDDKAILNVYAQLLERKGLQVELCFDSTQVVDLLRKKDVDMIFTDIQMPQMNGFELVKKIRNLGGKFVDIPIVALSARTDVSEKDFKSAGFTTFISKPIPFGFLYKTIYDLTENPVNMEQLQNDFETEKANGFDALIEYVKEDKDVSLDILNTFLNDNREKLESLKSGVKAQNWESIQSIAHKMLPLITLLGENEVREKLVKLEVGEKDFDIVNSIIPLVEKINKDAEKYIQRYTKLN